MMRGPRGPRSAGNFKFIFSCPTTNFKTMQNFLFFLAFEIDFTGLNGLGLDEDVDETKKSPFDSNEIDEEPEWHAEDNFIETIIKNMLSVILATPGGMLIGLVLWVIYIHFTKAIISLFGGGPSHNSMIQDGTLLNNQNLNNQQEDTAVNSNSNNIEMQDLRVLGRVFGTPSPQDLPMTDSISAPISDETQPPALETPPKTETENKNGTRVVKEPSLEMLPAQVPTYESSEPNEILPFPDPSLPVINAVVDFRRRNSPSQASKFGSFKSTTSSVAVSFKSFKEQNRLNKSTTSTAIFFSLRNYGFFESSCCIILKLSIYMLKKKDPI